MREPTQVHDVGEQVGLHNDLILGSKARQHRHRRRGCLKQSGLPGGAVTARVVSGDCFVGRPGSFTSVRQLTDTIGAFIYHWNDHPRPFAWTKDADEILASIHRAKTKTSVLTDH